MTLPREPVSRRGRPAKPPLSRQSIVEATLGLIRERGVAELTLRGVATAVETGPASLYAYFGSRDALLEHALDAVYRQVRLVAIGDDWRTALAATIENTIDALERYPGLGSVALGSIPVMPGALRLAEHELCLMEHGGVEGSRAALAIDVIAQLVASTAVEHATRTRAGGADTAQGSDTARRAYELADPDRFPRVHALAAQLTGPDERARRAYAVNTLIRGIETG